MKFQWLSMFNHKPAQGQDRHWPLIGGMDNKDHFTRVAVENISAGYFQPIVQPLDGSLCLSAVDPYSTDSFQLSPTTLGKQRLRMTVSQWFTLQI